PEALQNICAEQEEGRRQLRALSRDADRGLPVDTQALQALNLRLEAIECERQALEQQRSQLPGNLEVCPRLVAQVISAWTGIPVEQLALEPNEKVLGFADALRARILGQEHAVQALDRALRAVAAGLNKADAPVGVFLLVGPSGVGKTETALALADLLYGGERFITTINMSEYQEKHALSRLIGAPPGYIGYGEGGILTEAVRQRPYSVVLLDEVEKADPEILNLFYQIFDKGRANDGEGREIDFRNTLLLMTSNLGSDCISTLCAGGQRPDAQALQEVLHPVLRAHFKPALLARMRVVPYYPIAGQVLHDVARLKLASLGERLHRRKLAFTYSSELVTYMTERCAHGDSGARYIDQWIERYLLPQMVDRLLSAMALGELLSLAHAQLDGNGQPMCEFS
ncbi:AAA family ATPase, partial [Pseudomonas antarctica]